MKTHNRWIVIRDHPKEHKVLDRALAVLAEKEAAEPGKWSIFRIKRAEHEPGCQINQNRGREHMFKCGCPQGLYEAARDENENATQKLGRVA